MLFYMNIILIGVLYGVGSDKVCSQDVKSVILAYLIIKASLIVARCALCGISLWSSCVGIVFWLMFTLLWILGMCAYYIVSIVYFFDSSNNCLEDGTIIWVALLLIVIEAISMLIFFTNSTLYDALHDSCNYIC